MKPIKVSCADHEGARAGRIQTWDGKNWKISSDWYTADDSRDRTDGQGDRSKIRGREEDHVGVPDQLMSNERQRRTASKGGGGNAASCRHPPR